MIGEPRYLLERLGQYHDRVSFSCTREPVLEMYLTDDARALRDDGRNVSAVHVLVDTEIDRRIAGYFTLSNSTLVHGSLPRNVERHLNRYPEWGAIKLGRLARDDRYSDRGIGPILIAHAFTIALGIAKVTGSIALRVDAKNEHLATWYERLGFRRLLDAPNQLFITNQTMAAYLERIDARLRDDRTLLR